MDKNGSLACRSGDCIRKKTICARELAKMRKKRRNKENSAIEMKLE